MKVSFFVFTRYLGFGLLLGCKPVQAEIAKEQMLHKAASTAEILDSSR